MHEIQNPFVRPRKWLAEFEVKAPYEAPEEMWVTVEAERLERAVLLACDTVVDKIAEKYGDAAILTAWYDMWSICQVEEEEEEEEEEDDEEP